MLQELREQRCFQRNQWIENSLQQPSSISECQPAPRWLFHYIITVSVAYLVTYTLNRPKAYAARLACCTSAVFSSVIFFLLLSDKTLGKRGDQPEPAPDRSTDQQNRRSFADLGQHSPAGHVCLRGKLPNNYFLNPNVDSWTSK